MKKTTAKSAATSSQKEEAQRKLGHLLSKVDALKLSADSQNSMAAAPSNSAVPNDGMGIIQLDPWLGPWKDEIALRHQKAVKWIEKLDKFEGGLDKFSKVRLAWLSTLISLLC